MDTLTVYHAYTRSRVVGQTCLQRRIKHPLFGPGNPGRRVLIDDVLQTWYDPDPRQLVTSTPWHPRPFSIVHARAG